MVDPPQYDWAAYESIIRPYGVEELRRMTPAQKFAVCEALYRVFVAPYVGTPEWKQYEQRRWQEKLRIRMKMVDAFRKLDQHCRERGTDQTPANGDTPL
jgi:hypothetical protein